jgi:IS30 family transposase
MHGTHVTADLTRAIEERGATPKSITLDNGSEFLPAGPWRFGPSGTVCSFA